MFTTDPDNPVAGDTFIYTLVNGAGATDNAKFTIVNDQLFALGPIDFDNQQDYSIRVRTTDSGTPNQSFEKVLTIHSTNVNERATGISTDANPVSGIPNSVPENQPVGAIVGLLLAADPDVGDTNTFTLVSGVGSTDNAQFRIVNGQLVTNAIFDFETKSSYTVRIRTVDSQGLAFETPVTISVTNVDEVPTAISLSNNTIAEDLAVGGEVGTLSTQDIDVPESFTYSLVSGTGATDNFRFSISGNKLVVAGALNFEERPSHSYTVRVRSTDGGGLTFEQIFTINVTDVNEAPTDLTLTPGTINENLGIGALVGTLAPVDPDANDLFTYQFVSGQGSDDNAAFQLNGNKLQAAVAFDFETKSSYTVRIRATDAAGHSVERQFVIGVQDTKDGPIVTMSNAVLTTTGRKAVLVDSQATVTDNDSPNFNGGKLKVFIQSGEQTGDTLSLQREKGRSAMKLKLVKGKTILKLGTQEIATVHGGTRGVPLEINFGSEVSQELFQRVTRLVTFRGKPFAAARQVAVQAFDELGLPSNVEIRNINVN